MTEPVNLRCSACGHTAPPQEFESSEGYMVCFHAPAGVYRDVIVAESPEQALEQAKKANLENAQFDEDGNSYRIQQIIVGDQDGNERAVWSDPAYIAEKHSGEILELLNELLGSVEDVADARSELDQEIANLDSAGQEAARRLNSLGVNGGNQ